MLVAVPVVVLLLVLAVLLVVLYWCLRVPLLELLAPHQRASPRGLLADPVRRQQRHVGGLDVLRGPREDRPSDPNLPSSPSKLHPNSFRTPSKRPPNLSRSSPQQLLEPPPERPPERRLRGRFQEGQEQVSRQFRESFYRALREEPSDPGGPSSLESVGNGTSGGRDDYQGPRSTPAVTSPCLGGCSCVEGGAEEGLA